MKIQKIIHHTYEVYRTPHKRRAYRFTSKKAAKEFIAAIQDDKYIITLVPIRHTNFHSNDYKRIYAIQIVDKAKPDEIMYMQYYKLVIDQFSLQQSSDNVKE